MLGTKPKNNTRQYSGEVAECRPQTLSAVPAQREMSLHMRVSGRLPGGRDLWSGRFIRQAGKLGRQEDVQKRHLGSVLPPSHW